MEYPPFDRPGRFYRGNLHTHSNRSDGALSAADVARSYHEHGYDFVVVTDHFTRQFGFPVTDTRALRTPTFTTLLGAELHAPQLGSGDTWHLVAVGLPLDFAPPTDQERGPELAARAAAAGAFVGIAHPAWYGLTLDDAEAILASADAVEVYNETCAQLNDRGDSWYLADLLLARGHRVLTYAADDAHCQARPDRFAAWVHVRAEALNPAVILAALKAGHFYSSQGPEIRRLTIEGSQLHLECSPARAVFVAGRGARARSAISPAGDLTTCTLGLEPFAGSYCRLTVVDKAGKRAWTNPIWWEPGNPSDCGAVARHPSSEV
jgi:hypothetical protein